MAVAMLSLASNPFNPFTQFDLWYEFDRREGFDTAGLLDRLVSTSPDLPDEMNEQITEDAIDSLLANPNFAGLYVKVIKDAA